MQVLRWLLLIAIVPVSFGLSAVLFVGSQFSRGFGGSSASVLWAGAPLAAGAVFLAALCRPSNLLLVKSAAVLAIGILAARFASVGTEAVRELPVIPIYAVLALAYFVNLLRST